MGIYVYSICMNCHNLFSMCCTAIDNVTQTFLKGHYHLILLSFGSVADRGGGGAQLKFLIDYVTFCVAHFVSECLKIRLR